MQLNDDEYVLQQYRTTENLDTRTSVWSTETGQSPQEIALLAVSDIHPHRVLEVGSGKGSLAVRIVQTAHCDLVALDSSEAMVAASRSLGVETILGDVRDLPFEDDVFDVAVAAWMLYHVSPLERGLAELARVLRPNGRLVAITNGRAHLRELWNAAGEEHDEPAFSVENGADQLRCYFSKVERHDVATHADFPDRNTAAAYLRSINRGELESRLPLNDWPLRARGATAIFVADDPL